MNNNKLCFMDKATEIFEKHWKLRTGKELDETIKHHMQYCIDAINEALVIGQSQQACKTFLSEGNTTSATKCRFCGKEKSEH